VNQEKDEKTQPGESGPLVLVVDDSAAIMDVYHFVLVAAGYRVATAPDGGVGLLLAKELRPSIVILDLMMPKVSGLEFLERLPREVSAPAPPVTTATRPVKSKTLGSMDILLGYPAGRFAPLPPGGNTRPRCSK